MPTFHKVTQGEADWVMVRLGKVTASEIDSLVTPLFAARTGDGPRTYLCAKLAEKWRNQPLPAFTSFDMEQGQILEDEARNWYCLEHDDYRLTNVGFVEHEDGRCGCSPDALLGEDGGLEIKCPKPTNHVRYLIDGTLPKDYAAQVHMSLYVTGRKWWRFVSYRRGFPAFVLHVERDEAIMEKIAAALAEFYKAFDLGMRQLKEIA